MEAIRKINADKRGFIEENILAIANGKQTKEEYEQLLRKIDEIRGFQAQEKEINLQEASDILNYESSDQENLEYEDTKQFKSFDQAKQTTAIDRLSKEEIDLINNFDKSHALNSSVDIKSHSKILYHEKLQLLESQLEQEQQQRRRLEEKVQDLQAKFKRRIVQQPKGPLSYSTAVSAPSDVTESTVARDNALRQSQGQFFILVKDKND